MVVSMINFRTILRVLTKSVNSELLDSHTESREILAGPIPIGELGKTAFTGRCCCLLASLECPGIEELSECSTKITSHHHTTNVTL
jgi:hypothetical protein